MDVNVQFLQELFIQPQLPRVGTDPSQRSLHRLLHHLAELSSHGEAALALHLVGLDEEHVAPSRSPSKSHGHACTLSALSDFGVDAYLDAAQKFLNDFFGQDKLIGLAFGNTTRLLTAHRSDIAFEIANAGLTRVVADDVAHDLFWKLNLVSLDPIFFDLPRNQVAISNVDLFVLNVS